MSSWKDATAKQYKSVVSKWRSFCTGIQAKSAEASVPLVLDFLMAQYEHGMSSSAIGTYRSALSTYLPKAEGYLIGEHPTVVRFVKSFKNKRPS